MAKCDEGYLCDVCGEEVPAIEDSDLYLRFILGEVRLFELSSAPERHVRCNPVQAQFICSPEFDPIVVTGPFDKRELDPKDVQRREELVTRGWQRLQQVRALELAIDDYPLDEVRRRTR